MKINKSFAVGDLVVVDHSNWLCDDDCYWIGSIDEIKFHGHSLQINWFFPEKVASSERPKIAWVFMISPMPVNAWWRYMNNETV